MYGITMRVDEYLMGYMGYVSAREAAIKYGEPVFQLAFLVSIALILSSAAHIWKRDKFYNYVKKLQRFSLVLLLVGFLILVWLHIKIYQNIELVNLSTGESLGRYYVPLWIENEKMYFWLLWTGVFVYLLNRKKDGTFMAVTNISYGIFVLATFLYSNPFASPLPQFHEEISAWHMLLGQGNFMAAWGYTGQLYGRMVYFYNTTYMWVHPPLLFIAYASLVITFLGSVFMLVSKEKSSDKIAYDHAKFGYILLTIGLLIGYPWAIEAWRGTSWWWDPKVSGSLMMWMFYTAYLHSYIYVNRAGMRRVTAIIGILCFLSLVFTYLLTYISSGVHAYG